MQREYLLDNTVEKENSLQLLSEVTVAAARNPFDLHTEVLEEFQKKLFYVLGDLGLMTKPQKGKRPGGIPKDLLSLVAAIGTSKSLSGGTRKRISAGVADARQAYSELKSAPADSRRTVFTGTAIIWASESWGDLDRGLKLIESLFPERKQVASSVQGVRDLIRSGQGRIYGTANQPLLDPWHSTSLPGVVYSAKGVLKADAAAAFGAAVSSPIKTPQVIAGIAVTASLGASVKDVLDWAFPEEVPLFPGGTGPYNPYPNPNPA